MTLFLITPAVMQTCADLSKRVIRDLKSQDHDAPTVLIVAAMLISAYAYGNKRPVGDYWPCIQELADTLQRAREANSRMTS